LDEGGGPNWSGNFVDSPVIINNTIDEFYKQPMYYALGHFSKYIPEDSVRIDMKVVFDDPNLFGTAFLRPDGKRTVVLLNR
jgi:glucosylceramidase